MRAFDSEFRACLELVLGGDAPEPDYDPPVFYRQWLAERNLGLVPVAEAGTFDWPGPWIARVRSDEDHAVVMFGSPSGALHDPAGAFAAGGAVVEGWVLARLDPLLPDDAPYGRVDGLGRVKAILVAPAAEAPLVRVETAPAVAGRGLEGDRYHRGEGTFSGVGRGYQLTLVEAEVLDEIDFPWELARRNVVTEGIALNALVGRRFRVGDAECVGRRLAEPCLHLERLTRPGILRPLVHRGGLRADILSSGAITIGDQITPL